MGLGIAAMHYMGMAAMEMEARYTYRPLLFTASVLIAVIVSIIALYIFSTLQKYMSNRLVKTATSIIMGLAIASMHYTGMKAIVFYQLEDSVHVHHSPHMNVMMLGIGIGIVVAIFLGLSGLSGVFDKYVNYRFNYIDPLTRLPNRRLFEQSLKADSHQALSIIHLHGLEKWNTGYGYNFGDELISMLAGILKNSAASRAELYRIEGNRFAMLGRPGDLKTIMERAGKAAKEDIIIQEQRAVLEIISVLAEKQPGETAAHLYTNAIAVLHHPSITYMNQIIVYDPSIHTYNLEQKLVMEIDEAMHNGQLYLVYQPKVMPGTGEVHGVEALLRWNHPIYGMLSPALFIPALEKGKKMFDVTDWIIEKVCIQAAVWKKQNRPSAIAVNIPGPYITSPRLVKVLLEGINKNGIEAENIELEITETSVVNHIEQAARSIGEIRSHGFSVALDDFGTGVSSLSYLKLLPITTLKIDKSFVDDVPHSAKDASILEAITALCRSLDLHVVVEGVETREQVEFLMKMSDAAIIQGYFYSAPQTAGAFESWTESFVGGAVPAEVL